MLFNLEADTGDRVTGYLVPDTFSAVPIIRVCSNGEKLLVLSANEVRNSLVVAGRHETGQCGFTVDSTTVPELSSLTDLELFDDETNLLIYRRPQSFMIQKKLLRLEFHLLPLWRFDDAFNRSFQYFARGVESLGRETVTQLFLLNQVNSVYVSGRILYKNYSYFIDSHFQTIFLLQDPYEELAERLLVLNKSARLGTGHLGTRDSLAMRAAIQFAATLPLRDDKSMLRALRQMPPDVAATFANPLVRQLTSSTPDEMPSGGAVATALDLLASFAVVGLRHESDRFLHGVAELLNLDPARLPRIPQFSQVPALARLLKSASVVDALLEKDLELYHYINEAFKKSITDQSQGMGNPSNVT
jgi:hypothetical protein